MDYIDKRNQMEKMAKSIIKRRNVIYTTPELIGAKAAEEEDTEADQILEHLQQMKQQGEEQKRLEIARMVEEQEQNQAEINRILRQKEEQLVQNIEAGKE